MTLLQRKFMLLLALVTSAVTALAPPHPNFTEWESVHDKRVRRNVTYNYRPTHLSPEYCRYLSEDECQLEDEALAIAKDSRRLALTEGKLKVLVLLCRFSDHTDRELPEKSYFEKLFNGEGVSDINPVGSIKEWFYVNSLEKYDVTFDVQDWATTLNPESYYADGMSGLRGANIMQEMFVPLLDQLEASNYDFGSLDTDEEGSFDHLVVIHSGYSAEIGTGIDGCETDPADRIWSQGTARSSQWYSSDSIFRVTNYMLAGAFYDCSGNPVRMGIIVHEYMHGLGPLIDLYDLDFEEGSIPLGGTGRFGIMSNLYGWDGSQSIPGHLNPFSRMTATWLEPIEITEDGYYPVQPSEISSQIYIISSKFPSGEYLLIENRQPILWDSNWPTGGIVIYKVDNNADGQKNRGYPGHPNWPVDHYQVAVLQADGKYEIEKGESLGDEGDFWMLGQKLGSGGSWPNTYGFSNGDQVKTGIEIEIMTNSQNTMLIHVTGLS